MSHASRVFIGAAAMLAIGLATWQLVDVGRTNEYAGHVMFVPLFSVLAAWGDRDRLRATARPGRPAGIALLVAGFAVLAAGYSWRSDLVLAASVPLTTAGAVLSLFGASCLRAAAFPVGFLVMMAPLPQPVVAAVTLELQMFAASFAASVLRVVGIPVYHVGVRLELPQMTLYVAEVCNGLRFLLALTVMTLAFAQITQPTALRKVLLVAAAIVVAIFANAVRVAVIAVGVYFYGPEAASGTIHNLIGKGVWGLTLLPLVGLGVWLRRRPVHRSVATLPEAAAPVGGDAR